MAGRRQGRASQANGSQIPQRVEDAARTMMNNASSGPRRGYIPNGAGQPQQMPGWQQAPQGYYGTQNQQNPYGGYYAPQQPQQPQQGYYQPLQPQQMYYQQQPVNGGQRGYTPAYGSGSGKQPKPKKKKHTILTVLACTLLAAALGTGGYFAVSNHIETKTINEKITPYDGLFCPGVYVDGIHLGGMTPQQAQNSVDSQIRQQHDNWKVQLTFNGEVLGEINADMLGFAVDTSAVLTQAWAQGHTGTAEQRYEEMLRLEQEPYNDYTAKPEGDTSVIDQKLAEIKAAIDTPARDATMTFVPSESYPFLFEDEAYGRSLDTEPLKERLYQMASTMETGTVEITPESIAPAVRVNDLKSRCVLRAEATTKIDHHSSDERNKNIARAFEFISGTVLEPGQTFSFNKVVGERSLSRGFYEAIEYVSGEHVTGVGGGACQASTTVYQAALKAGLNVTKRYFHNDKVSYADYGLDATVYWDRKDLVFKNNTDGNIYITAVVERDPDAKKKSALRTRVDIYGLYRGDVRYELESEIAETIINTQKPKYKKDTNGEYTTYKDEQVTVVEARDGMKVNVYLVEYTGAFLTDRKYLYTDTYEPQPEVIYVGTKNR